MHLCICFIASTYNIYQHIICIQDIFNILARSCYYFGQYWILNIDTGLIRLIRASKGWRLGKYQTWSPSCRIYIFVFFIFDCLIFSIAFWYLKVMKISKIYHQNGVSWNVPCEHVSKTIHHWIVFEVCGVHNVDYLQDPVWIICWTVSDLNDRERLVAHSIWSKTLQKWCESLSEWLLFVWFYWCDKLDRVPTWLCKWVGEPD